jgi:hypothetical protein
MAQANDLFDFNYRARGRAITEVAKNVGSVWGGGLCRPLIGVDLNFEVGVPLPDLEGVSRGA